MKQIWIAILIMIAGASLHAQTGSIVRGAGIVYTDGPPNFDAHPKGAWIAIDTTSGYYWLWDKQAEDWVDGGGLIQSTGATGAPSYTPDLQHSRYAVNAGDSIFHYRAGSWRLASGALPDLSAYLQWGDTTTTIATKSDLAGVDLSAYPQRTELADTAAAIRGDFPVNTDAQTLSFSSPSLSISNGNSVNLSALVSGYVTGSGTTGYVPYFTGSNAIGSSGLKWESNLYLRTNNNQSVILQSYDVAGYARIQGNNNYLQVNTANSWFNSSLGIGRTSSPTARLHVTGSGSTSATTTFLAENSVGVIGIKTLDNTYTGFGMSPVNYIDVTAATLTGSSATSALGIQQTWNTSGNPTAIKLDITETASGASSLLMDLRVGGSSKFSVSKGGAVVAASSYSAAAAGFLAPSGLASAPSYTFNAAPTTGMWRSGNDVAFSTVGTERIRIANDGLLKFGGTTSSFPSIKRSTVNLQARLADDSDYTDIEVLDEAYGAGWNGSNEVPTKNAIYDKIETIGGGGLNWSDTTVLATQYYVNTNLADTASAIRGDFPMNTDAQTLSFSSPSLSISNGNSVNLSALVSGYVTGSGTTGYVPYFTGSSAIGNSGVYWDNANSRLGISTASPSGDLHVYRGQNVSIVIERTNNIQYGALLKYQSSGDVWVAGLSAAGDFSGSTGLQYFIGRTKNTPAFIINQSDNVGIGQTTPTARLHVTGPGSTSATFNGRGENSSNVATWTSRDDGLFTAQKLSITSTTGPTWTSGTGSPEGVVTAPVGSIYSRTDGGAGTSLYVKESGAGNTGWVGK